MADSFPRDRVLYELRALRAATRALHRRLDALSGEVNGQVDGEASGEASGEANGEANGDLASDPRFVEIARRAIAERRAKPSAHRRKRRPPRRPS